MVAETKYPTDQHYSVMQPRKSNGSGLYSYLVPGIDPVLAWGSRGRCTTLLNCKMQIGIQNCSLFCRQRRLGEKASQCWPTVTVKPKLKRGDKARFLCAAMACRRALELFKVTDLEIFGHVEETRAKQVEAAFANPEGYFAECRTNMEWLDVHKKQQVKIRKKRGQSENKNALDPCKDVAVGGLVWNPKMLSAHTRHRGRTRIKRTQSQTWRENNATSSWCPWTHAHELPGSFVCAAWPRNTHSCLPCCRFDGCPLRQLKEKVASQSCDPQGWEQFANLFKYIKCVHAEHVSYRSACALKPKATRSASQPSSALHALSPPLRALCDPARFWWSGCGW